MKKRNFKLLCVVLASVLIFLSGTIVTDNPFQSAFGLIFAALVLSVNYLEE